MSRLNFHMLVFMIMALVGEPFIVTDQYREKILWSLLKSRGHLNDCPLAASGDLMNYSTSLIPFSKAM
jgi:hypothetical protein